MNRKHKQAVGYRFYDVWLKIVTWADRTFGKDRPFDGVAEHIKRELDEYKRDRELEELADIFILAVDLAHINGVSFEQLVDAIERKYSINLKRKWKKPDHMGVIEHDPDHEVVLEDV